MSAVLDFLIGSTKKDGKKSNNSKEKGKKSVSKVPRSVQQTIPYESVYPNGIIRTGSDRYSKTYKLTDVNFKTEEQGIQESMFLDFEGLLNSLEPGQIGQVTIFNKNIDSDTIKNGILLQPAKDTLNHYRDEFNDILINKMQEGKNNLVKEKYYSVSVEAPDIEEAARMFIRVDNDVNSKVARITKTDTRPLSIDDRLALLYDMYNINQDMPFKKKIEPILKSGRIDLKQLNGMGLSTKDLIAPESITINKSTFQVGDVWGCAVFFDNFPTSFNAEVLSDISDVPCNMITSVLYNPIPGDQAALMVKHQLTNINENIIRAQKNAAKNNYSADILPSELQRAKEEAEELRRDMQSRNQKLFKVTAMAVLFADDEESLKQNINALKSVGISHLLQVKVLQYQQEAGFDTCLPFADHRIAIDRVLTTESASAFMPFSVQELNQDTGRYYGLNGISRALIMYDRTSADNYNGLIFGKPGSGKSMAAKMEIILTLLQSNDDVYIIDPEGEYLPLVKAFNGQQVKIAIGSKSHINPLDMDVQFSGESGADPVAAKCDFLTAICETIVGAENLNPLMVNIIHKCGRRIYKAYWEHMRVTVQKKGITCDRASMPTLVDFYQELLATKDPQAQMLAASLEMYCIGNYDLFAHKTDINAESRFIVYDIKDVPAGMTTLGLQICLNDIWNRTIENRKKKKKTWFYVDEFYLLLKNEASAKFLQMIYKRARKWGGVPTGITQNVGDLLTSDTAGTILNNCNFILMMNQSQIDRMALAKLYNISENLIDYISDKPAGTGLVYTGKLIVPFINEFPTDTDLYRIMSTKATEDNAQVQ